MSQASLTKLDKAAVLLSRLDPRSLDRVLEMLGPEFAGKLRPLLAAVSRRKDFTTLSEQVLQEFRELQQDVRAAVSDSPALNRMHTGQPPAAETPSAQASPTEPAAVPPVAAQNPATGAEAKSTTSPATESSAGSEVEFLSTLPPAVLAAALKPESARIVATVLKQLPAEFSGKVLEALPGEQRQPVFLMMADTVQVSPVVIGRVIKKLKDVCQTIDLSVVEHQDRRLKSLIGVLQSVQREERIRLLETLTERDPELASKIDDLMYDYTDIMRIEDRSVQKLLGQLEQKVVALALKTAPEDLRQKVFKNLSERVRLALNEEMELLSGVTAAKADQARKELANVIRAQDKEGLLVWVE